MAQRRMVAGCACAMPPSRSRKSCGRHRPCRLPRRQAKCPRAPSREDRVATRGVRDFPRRVACSSRLSRAWPRHSPSAAELAVVFLWATSLPP
uniref:Uncharacterized protein n=1 Tax=Ixodes ricinus TaxID=34613 RepID=A0A147BF29_IXORI